MCDNGFINRILILIAVRKCECEELVRTLTCDTGDTGQGGDNGGTGQDQITAGCFDNKLEMDKHFIC